MSKLGTMKSSPGWVSQNRSQVREGRTLPVALPGENMEIHERTARSIGAPYSTSPPLSYVQQLTPQDDGFLWVQSSALTLWFNRECPRVCGECNHLPRQSLAWPGYHFWWLSSGTGVNSSPLPIFQIKFYRYMPHPFVYRLNMATLTVKQHKQAIMIAHSA